MRYNSPLAVILYGTALALVLLFTARQLILLYTNARASSKGGVSPAIQRGLARMQAETARSLVSFLGIAAFSVLLAWAVVHDLGWALW